VGPAAVVRRLGDPRLPPALPAALILALALATTTAAPGVLAEGAPPGPGPPRPSSTAGGSAFVAELQTGGTTKHLQSVWFTDSSRGWAGGNESTLLRTVDSGRNWVKQTGIAAESIGSIRFTDPLHGDLAATAGWGPNPDPAYSGPAHVLKYTDGTMVRDWSAVLRTSDGGASWQKTFTPTNFVLTSAPFVDDKKGFVTAFGRWDHTDADVWSTKDGGKSWPRYSGWMHYDGGDIAGPDTWVAVGDEVARTTNGGASWLSVPTPGPSAHLSDVMFHDPARGWAVGAGGKVLLTTDGGASWSAGSSGVAADLHGVHFVSETEGWAVGAGGTILRSTDGGLTWSALPSPTSADLHEVHFAEPRFGWAVGASGTVVFIHDGPPPPPPPQQLAAVSVSPASAGLRVGEKATFDAAGTDANGMPVPSLTCAWTISPPVATLAPQGCRVEVTATSLGSATLTATGTFNGTSKDGTASLTVRANSAPVAPTLSGPGTATTGVQVTFSVSATDPDGDRVRYLVEWGDSTNDSGALVASGQSVSFPHAWNAKGTYPVRALASDENGSASSWSPWTTVVVSDPAPQNRPPAAPSLSGPASGLVNQSLQFTFSPTDPDGDRLTLAVDWGDGTTGTLGPVDSGASAGAAHAFAAPGAFDVRAQARDPASALSPWSLPWRVTVNRSGGIPGPDLTPPQIAHSPPGPVPEKKKIELAAAVSDSSGVASATLRYRPAGASAWKSVPMVHATGDVYSATIPALDVKPPRLEYYFTATDQRGNAGTDPVAGDAGPHQIEVEAEAPPVDPDPPGSRPGAVPSAVLLAALLLVGAVAAAAVAGAAVRARRRRAAREREEWERAYRAARSLPEDPAGRWGSGRDPTPEPRSGPDERGWGR
jgi:photosystem II stability/assembly factor-like uncharacterized protein